MTTEEKAKAYDEALEKAKEMMDNCSFETTKVVCQELFPELTESEDERVRKWLVDYFKSVGKSWIHRDISPEQIIAYLEKQKEQKPAEWSEEEEKRIQRICDFLWKNRKGDTDTIYQIEKDADWLKSLRPQPKQEWSEDEERLIKTSIYFIKDFADTGWENAVECIDFLKSLRPDSYKNCNSRWKPSEEQILAIVEALKYLPNNKNEWMILNTLIDVLRKLM